MFGYRFFSEIVDALAQEASSVSSAPLFCPCSLSPDPRASAVNHDRRAPSGEPAGAAVALFVAGRLSPPTPTVPVDLASLSLRERRRIRLATPSEIRVVQEMSGDCWCPAKAAWCWRWSAASILRRQRVVVEGWGMGDLTRWGEDAIAKLFADVTAFGWLEVEGRAG